MLNYSVLLVTIFVVSYVVGGDVEDDGRLLPYPFEKQQDDDSPQMTLEERTKSMSYGEDNYSGKFRIGDALLSDEQVSNLFHEDASFSIINDEKLRWTDAIIPYELGCSVANLKNAVNAIKAAMRQWEKKTCIRFVERTNEKNYLYFKRDTHCWGHVGMNSDYTTTISCGFGCETENVMAHEIGHAVGFYHEQNRRDRDSWVNIHWNNIGKFKTAFDIVKNTYSMGQPYDYASIMHYPWSAFSSTGQKTMTPRRRTSKVPYVEISRGDITQTRLMYKCDAVEAKRRSVQGMIRKFAAPETKEGSSLFQSSASACRDINQNCAAWAAANYCTLYKSVIRICRKSCRKCATVTRKGACVDTNANCRAWAGANYCGTNRGVQRMCKKSCGKCITTGGGRWGDWSSYGECTMKCGGGVQTRTRVCNGGSNCRGKATQTKDCNTNTCPRGDCKSTGKYCTYWGRKGYCERNNKHYGYMQKQCCLTCKQGVRPPIPTAKPDGQCLDREKSCQVWKERGYCQKTKVYMEKNCCKTCTKTTEPKTDPPSEKTTQKPDPPSEKTTQKPSETPIVTEKPITPPITRTYLGAGELCEDSRTDCASYARRGECTRNRGFMDYYCKKTCKSYCPTCGIDCDSPGLKPQGACASPLGLSYTGSNSRKYKLPNRAFSLGLGVGYHETAGWSAYAHNARLYFPDNRATKSIGGWCARYSDLEAKKQLSLIVDLGRRKQITHIATQGRDKYFERVSEFKIEHSAFKNTGYKPYMEEGKAKVFTGSCDYRTPVLNKFSTPIVARFMKYIPTKWNYPCVRLEYYGCNAA